MGLADPEYPADVAGLHGSVVLSLAAAGGRGPKALRGAVVRAQFPHWATRPDSLAPSPLAKLRAPHLLKPPDAQPLLGMISSQALKVAPEQSVALSVEHLTVAVRPGEAKILNDVSFELAPGQMMAIMGGSGSGKTTLLNTLLQRLNYTNKSLVFGGAVRYRNAAAEPLKHVKNAYMLQTDCFLPGLTVHETLRFLADLRMPAHTSAADKAALIELLLDILELQLLRDEIICRFGLAASNLSGGEQRRVTVAIQLLSKPAVLFLDEPTTGLDTSLLLKLVQTLRRLASPEFGVSVVLSIHQPRPEIALQFDAICLLTRGGRMVYYGSYVDSVAYFGAVPFLEARAGGNVMEYIMDLSVKDTTSTEERERELVERINMLVEHWKRAAGAGPQRLGLAADSEREADAEKHEVTALSPLGSGPGEVVSEEKEAAPGPGGPVGAPVPLLGANPSDGPSGASERKLLEHNLRSFAPSRADRILILRETAILTRRTFLLSRRDYLLLVGLNLGLVVLACTIGWMFYRPTPDVGGIRTLTSCLYVMLEVVGFCPMFIEIERLWTADILFFYREYQENYVSIFGFLVSRRLGRFLLEDLPLPVLFALISYFMFGLRVQGLALYFFIYLALTILTQLITMAGALALVAISPDFAVTTMLVNIYYQLQNSACGYFVNAATMPVYVRWTKYTAYFWYAFGALTSNQYTDWMGACPYDDAAQCAEYSGNEQLAVLGYPRHWIVTPMVCLVAYFFILHFIIAAALYFKRLDVKVAKQKTDRISKAAAPAEPAAIALASEEPKAGEPDSSGAGDAGPDPGAPIDIFLNSLHLSVLVKDPTHPAARRSHLALLGRTPRAPKVLLNGILAHFAANTVNAIMGPSGSGKTTTLNFLLGRLLHASTYAHDGGIFLNRQPILVSELSRISAYVTQHDTALIPNLTVRETLYYQARLRLPLAEHARIPHTINALIRRIGLLDCANTLIGGELKKGISGGEKRRVSIAIQLLSRPKILFLDEPTLGLDSATAASILTLLKELAAESNATIITTIHQPSEEIFLQFSNVLLLARGGRVAFNGDLSRAKSYFEGLGFACPPAANVADYFLDLVSRGLSETLEEASARVDAIVESWPAKTAAPSGLPIDIARHYRQRLPVRATFPVIVARQFRNSLRSGDVLFARAFQTVLLAIIHALYFSPLKNNPDGISNRLGLVQEVLNIYFVGLINNVTLFPIERDIFYLDYSDGIYGPVEFSASYLLNELPMEIVPCLFFAAMVVFVIGLPRTPGMFFAMFFASFVSTNCGESLGIFVNSIFDHLGLAMNLLSTLVILAVFMGGTMSINMPKFFKAWNYLNPMKYAVGVCANLGFEDQHFKCPGGAATCDLDSGENVLRYYHLKGSLRGYFGGLVACLFIYRIIAVAMLYIKVKRR